MKGKLSAIISLALIITLVLAGCGAQAAQPAEASATGAGAAQAGAARADYPTKPITLICGYSAGGSSDLLCRILGESLTKELGQPVTVVNKTGGGGFVAWSELVKTTEPDGYTFALINTPNLVNGRYDEANPRDFDHLDMDTLVNHVTDYNVIACRKDEDRFNDFGSFIEYAKSNDILFGTSATGIMADDDTIAQQLNQQLGTKLVPVVTTGSKDNETYLMNKSTDILIGNVSDVLTGKQNGEFKVLCVFAPERVSLMDDVPTCEELGLGAIYGSSSRGYAFPAGVDPEIRKVFMDALVKSIESPECVKALEDIGAVTELISGEEYVAFLNNIRENAKTIYGITD